MSSAAGGSDSCFLHLTNAGGDIRSIEVPRENCTSFPLRFMPLCLEFRIFKAYKHLLVEKQQSVSNLQMVLHLFPADFAEVGRDFAAFKTKGAKSAGHITGAPCSPGWLDSLKVSRMAIVSVAKTSKSGAPDLPLLNG